MPGSNITKRLEEKPDGSYIFTDADGREHTGWMPPELLEEILRHPGVQALTRVKIREPDDSIREDFWPVDEATATELSDADGILHVMSSLEGGRVKYYFIARHIWDRLDEMIEIQMNPSLSAEEKSFRMRELMRP